MFAKQQRSAGPYQSYQLTALVLSVRLTNFWVKAQLLVVVNNYCLFKFTLSIQQELLSLVFYVNKFLSCNMTFNVAYIIREVIETAKLKTACQWTSLGKFSYSDDHNGRTQTENHEMSIIPGPQNTFGAFIQNVIYIISALYRSQL